MKTFLLFTMIFLHIVDDYYLQGILGQLKQKVVWKQNAPQAMYKYDYIVALVLHGFSWRFVIHLPIILYNYVNSGNIDNIVFISIIVNNIIHSVVDDLKANRYKINLIVDQSIHLIQIFIIWYVFIFKLV